MVYMYHSFLIHSSADGHLDCFHVLAMINSAAMNIGVHVSKRVFRYYSLSAIRVVSFAYLRLLILLPANLIPARDLSSLHFTWCTLYIKSRDSTLLTEMHIVNAIVFQVVMYGCESWTIKKAEHWITDAFKMWCWRRLLRVPWTARRSNQSILKKINQKYSLEGLMLKLKL